VAGGGEGGLWRRGVMHSACMIGDERKLVFEMKISEGLPSGTAQEGRPDPLTMPVHTRPRDPLLYFSRGLPRSSNFECVTVLLF